MDNTIRVILSRYTDVYLTEISQRYNIDAEKLSSLFNDIVSRDCLKKERRKKN